MSEINDDDNEDDDFNYFIKYADSWQGWVELATILMFFE